MKVRKVRTKEIERNEEGEMKEWKEKVCRNKRQKVEWRVEEECGDALIIHTFLLTRRLQA